jgi:uncharacterized repeat protein (TIGR01451 family)
VVSSVGVDFGFHTHFDQAKELVMTTSRKFQIAAALVAVMAIVPCALAADVSIVKTGPVGNVTAGTSFNYNLDVSVAGGGPNGLGIVAYDYLPAGVTLAGYSVSAGTVINAGVPGDPDRPFTWNIGGMLAGTTVSATLTVLVDPDLPAGAILWNDASVTSQGGVDPPNNNLSSWANEVDTSADLALTKFLVGAPVAGTAVHYEYQIKNLGPSVARNVTLRDFLPSQVDLLSVLVGGLEVAVDTTQGSNVLFVPLGDIPLTVTQPVMVFVNVFIKPNATGSLVNSADVNLHDTPDPVSGNNTASVTASVRTSADVSVWKTSTLKVCAGNEVFYTIFVKNNGPSDAVGVVVADDLPAGLTVESFTPPPANSNWVVVWTNSSVTFFYNGPFAAGQEDTLQIAALADRDLAIGTMLGNNVHVTSTTPDPVQTNNSYLAVTEVDCGFTDLSITKSSAPADFVTAGTDIDYTLTVSNVGPNPATNVVVVDYIPAGLTNIRYAPANPGSVIAGVPGDSSAPAKFLVGDMAPGGSVVLTFTALVDPSVADGTIIENSAAVTNDVADLDNANNAATDRTDVTTLADMVIFKFAFFPPAIAGGRISYELHVYNDGPSTAGRVFVRDFLPDGVEFVDATVGLGGPAVQITFVRTSYGIMFDVGDMPPTYYQPLVIFINAVVNSNVPDGEVLSNYADVFTDTIEPDLLNNVVTADLPVETIADMSVTKTAQPKVGAGEELVYTFTLKNNGPSDAEGVVFTDNFPASVTVESTTLGVPPAQLVIVGNAFQAFFDTIAAGQEITFQIAVLVSSSLPIGTPFINIAEVSATTSDPNPDNNTSSQLTVVDSGYTDLMILKAADPTPFVAGDPITYLILVANIGPNAAILARTLRRMSLSQTTCRRASAMSSMTR